MSNIMLWESKLSEDNIMFLHLTTRELQELIYEKCIFSHEGSKALAKYLENYEEAIGVPMRFDAVAIDSEYVEYKSLRVVAQNLGISLEDLGIDPDSDEAENEEYFNERMRLHLEDNTDIIEFDGGVIIENF